MLKIKYSIIFGIIIFLISLAWKADQKTLNSEVSYSTYEFIKVHYQKECDPVLKAAFKDDKVTGQEYYEEILPCLTLNVKHTEKQELKNLMEFDK